MLTLGSNISSLRVQRTLAAAGSDLQKVSSRLSSGLRITRASDDPAGLSVSEGLGTDAKVYGQGIRNFNDGVSMLNVAEGALSEMSNIVTRINELAEQAANGTLGNAQRSALDKEAQQLASEFARIAKSTDFNNSKLLDGSLGSLRLQGSYGESGGFIASLGGAIGTGTFGASKTFGVVGTTDDGIDFGDVNGDGNTDMLVASASGGAGYGNILLGDGTGSFASAVSYAGPSLMAWAAKLDDVDNDGSLDMIVVGEDSANNGVAVIRLNNGNGTFGAAVSYATETGRSFGVALEDIDNDGALDLITAGRTDIPNGYFTVRLGNGNGSFKAAFSYTAESHTSRDVKFGDLNGDGILDLVSAGYSPPTDGFISVRLGNANGSFKSATQYSMQSSRSNSVTLADFNMDGILDAATSGAEDSGNTLVYIRLGTGTGSFGSAMTLASGNIGDLVVKSGDVNGDGFADIVSAGSTGATAYNTVYLGNGNGSFKQAVSYASSGSQANYMTLADVDRDGVLEILSADDNGASAWITVRKGETTSGAAPLLDFSLKTIADARQALGLLNVKIGQLAAHRGAIGAVQSRLDSAVSNLQTAVSGFLDAKSRIVDADVAKETAELVRLKILQNSGAAILSQANQQPAVVLDLLRQNT